MRRHAFPLLFGLCVLASVLPLWVAGHLPAVDLPQHLFLVDVLGRLDEPGLPYREVYLERPGLTYVVFYYSVRGLAALVGVETAMRLWLTLVLAGIPLSLAVLLRALGRTPWLALLACPLVFTDNFYWGLVSFLSSLPLTILVLAFFVRALETPLADRRRSRLALAACGASLVALQLTHAAGMIFPAMALPLLLATTPSDWARRWRAVASLGPGVALFLSWLLAGVSQGRKLGAPGEPWKASAPLLDPANFVFHPVGEKLARLPDLLAGGFWNWADRPMLWAVASAAILIAIAGLIWRTTSEAPTMARLRPALLFALALGCFLLLPQDINGYMYQIYPRYSQLAALLLILVLPFPSGAAAKVAVPVAVAVALFSAGLHARLFRRFDREAQSFEAIVEHIPPHARVMHLVTEWGSGEATHAVYLHYAALAALRVGGIPSFTLALDPSFPVGYRPGAAPPASPWEWRPHESSWEQKKWYDVYLTRGEVHPGFLFGEHLRQVELAASADRWRLYRRKPDAP